MQNCGFDRTSAQSLLLLTFTILNVTVNWLGLLIRTLKFRRSDLVAGAAHPFTTAKLRVFFSLKVRRSINKKNIPVNRGPRKR